MHSIYLNELMVFDLPYPVGRVDLCAKEFASVLIGDLALRRGETEDIIGFFFRKSIRMGPVRVNLSKSGVGVSAGVKGLSVSAGPKGTYLNAGRKGLYYRTKLNPKKLTSRAVSGSSLLWILIFLGIGLAALFSFLVVAGVIAALLA